MKKKVDLNKTVFFTICSINYLPTAKILVSSLRNNVTDDIYLIVCDKKNAKIQNFFPDGNVKIVFVEDLGIKDFYEFKIRYSILEINTAIKPFVFKYLFRKNYKKAFYFDPDIVIERSLEKLTSKLDTSDAIVTPHLLSAYSDDLKPSLQDITNSGIYNLGFLGLKKGNTNDFLNWWSEKCKYFCYNDIEKNLFTDQKFCDYLPIFVKNTYIYSDYDANIAYWNLHERKITNKDNKFFSNGKEVLFFHFSGLVFNKNFKFKKLSKHEERFKSKIDYSLLNKIDHYLNLLFLFTEEFKVLKINSKYGFDDFKSIKLDNFTRAYIKEANDKNKKINFNEINETWFQENTSEFKEFSNIPRYLLGIYFARIDLQQTFDLHKNFDRLAYFNWISNEIALGNIRKDIFELLPKQKTNMHPKLILKNSIFIFLKRIYEINPDFFSNKIFSQIREKLRSFFNKKTMLDKDDHNIPDKILPNYSGTQIRKNGINLFGYFDRNTGLAVGVNLMKKVMESLNFELSSHNVAIDDNSLISPLQKDSKTWDISLFHINADQTANFAPFLKRSFINSYKIGFWAWELERFPSEPLANAKYLNEIWVPSNFIADSIERSCFKRPKVVPHPVLEHDKKNFVIKEKYKFDKKFNVTGIFDLNSYIDRKNPYGILDTFERACRNKSFQRNAHLILKISGQFNKKKSLSNILKKAKKAKISLTLIDENLSNQEMESLRNITDVFISLHRSEGFGLNVIENMSAGNIVIATNYSGNTDYMDNNNSLLVDYSLIPIEEEQYPYWAGQFWADPSVEDATEKLLWAYENSIAASKIAKRAQSFVNKEYSIDAVSKIVKREISRI